MNRGEQEETIRGERGTHKRKCQVDADDLMMTMRIMTMLMPMMMMMTMMTMMTMMML
jgi:hypothetical protein